MFPGFLLIQVLFSFQGYCLLYESMLPSVIQCRDKWLKSVSFVSEDEVRNIKVSKDIIMHALFSFYLISF